MSFGHHNIMDCMFSAQKIEDVTCRWSVVCRAC